MLRCLIALGLLLSATTSSFAGKTRPIPQSVLDAKTVFIDNVSGDEGLSNRADSEFKEWKRFSVVPDRDKADIILTILMEKHGVTELGDKRATITLQVMIPHDDIPQFSFSQEAAVKYADGVVFRGIRELRKRIQEQEKHGNGH